MPGGAVSPIEAPASEPATGGPTLGDLADKYEARSARASENVRYLAGAGIAVVWVLSRQSVQALTPDLLRTLVLCVGALALDFSHYVVAAFMFGRLKRRHEGEGKVRQDFVRVPRRTTLPSTILYGLKIVVLVLALVSLVANFVSRLGPAQAGAAQATAPAVGMKSAPGAGGGP